MNGALSLMPVSEETETVPFASILTSPFTLAVRIPEFRAVFVFVVGDLLFLAGAGNCLGIRRAKIGPLLFSLPRLQDKGSIADVRQLDFLIPQNAALERLVAVRIELVGVVQLNLRLAVSNESSGDLQNER